MIENLDQLLCRFVLLSHREHGCEAGMLSHDCPHQMVPKERPPLYCFLPPCLRSLGECTWI
jgi:hypothetical protein